MLMCTDHDFLNLNLKLSNAFESPKTWFGQNNLALNENKTKLIHFSLRDIPEENNSSCSVKLLGMTVD